MKLLLRTLSINCLLVVLLITPLLAQDVIIMRNGEEIQAQVEEVGQSEIKYKKFENLTGPIYSVSKSNVFMIRYENGQRDVFEEEKPEPSPAQSPIRTTQSQSYNYSNVDIKRARGSATFGYIATVPVIGLAVAASVIDDDTTSPALGGVATLILGITGPVVAGSGSRLREKSGVRGTPGLRVAGWVAYGFSVADAIIAVGLAASDVDVPTATGIAIGVLGSASLAMFSADVNNTARQAEDRLSARRVRLQPTFGYMAAHQTKYVPTLGVKIKFN